MFILFTNGISRYITNHFIFTGDTEVTTAMKCRRYYYGGKDAVIGYISAKKQLHHLLKNEYTNESGFRLFGRNDECFSKSDSGLSAGIMSSGIGRPPSREGGLPQII